MMIYNGEAMLLGRLSTLVAKAALLGEEVKVVNCAKIVISGKKVNTFAAQKQRRDRRGYPLKSSKLSRSPDRFVRRSIRGMLPWSQTRGREAFSRIMCYNDLPAEFASEKIMVPPSAAASKLPSLHYTTIGQICKQLGGKE
jgi:large subunit ribosomal protein L13